MLRQRWLAAIFLSCGMAAAQDAFLDRWNELRSHRPAGLEFKITVAKAEFYLGEPVPLQVTFTSSEPSRFWAETMLEDRVGRLNYMEEFIAAPAALAEDPLQGLQGNIGGLGGLSGGPVSLSDRPFSFDRILNEWIRFRQAGEYRVYVISRRVRAGREPGPPLELASNILTLRIRSAPQAWVEGQIAAARQILTGAPDRSPEARIQRRDARRILRFLNTPEAASELLLSLTGEQDVDSFRDYMGVLGSPYRAQLLPLMEQRLTALDQPVWQRYLESLAHLAELVSSGGPMPSYPAGPEAQKAWRLEEQRRADLRARKQREYASRLAANVPQKVPAARAVSLETLFNLAPRSGAQPEWMERVTAALIADFRSLPVQSQAALLDYRWTTLKRQEILPVLRDILANPPPQQFDPSLETIALRRLHELAPEEARRIILAEIKRPTRNLPFSTLAMLPDASLPELEDALVDRFDALLILRYATGTVVHRVEEIYRLRSAEAQNPALCAGPLVFYFLKYDPPFGDRLLRAEFARESAPPACYDIGFQFQQLGEWAYSPALERIAIGSLTSPKVPVKRGAAEVLGRFGSPAAEKPLWEAMEYFRSWWRGREAELDSNHENVQLERALRTALAQSRAWTFYEAELKRLLGLCTTHWCRAEVSEWLVSAARGEGGP